MSPKTLASNFIENISPSHVLGIIPAASLRCLIVNDIIFTTVLVFHEESTVCLFVKS